MAKCTESEFRDPDGFCLFGKLHDPGCPWVLGSDLGKLGPRCSRASREALCALAIAERERRWAGGGE